MDFLHSSVLFFDDEGDSLHLVIKSGPEKTEVEELLKKISHGGGLVLEEAAEYGITFAPPDYEVTGDEEVYSYRYIEDCCDKNRLLDLRPYRLNKQSKYPENFNATDVFLKYTTWEDALQGEPCKRFELPFDPDSPNSSDTDVPLAASACSGVKKKRKSGLLKRVHVMESSDSEFIDDEYSRNLELEDKSKKKQRKTSGSQDALPTGSSVAGTSGMKAQRNKRAKEISSESDDSLILEDSPPKRTLKVSRKEYTNSERKCIVNYIIENKACGSVKGREMWQRMEAKQICPGRTWQSLKEHYIKKILPNIEKYTLSDEDERNLKYQLKNSSDESSLESASISSSKRRDYTNAERMKIINYIIKCEAYDHVKGREFWRTVEMKKICPGRTWQSMKEHYMKQIIPKINTFDLPAKEVARLKRAFS